MERMEVDQCAGAAGGNGGGALRRSNSAPMITNVSDGMTVFSSNTSARYRRSSVSVNPSCPSRTLPFSPFSLCSERPDPRRQCLSYSPLTSWNSLAWTSITRFPFPRLRSHS
ncbi:protein FAM [Clarias magur]|uniref:Protein FAM n=1 Tax=Clarias magur TaxID=1594786 RepID=A0A8J4UB38_CLAMG|nr:protein FAM [Clarias magur]